MKQQSSQTPGAHAFSGTSPMVTDSAALP